MPSMAGAQLFTFEPNENKERGGMMHEDENGEKMHHMSDEVVITSVREVKLGLAPVNEDDAIYDWAFQTEWAFYRYNEVGDYAVFAHVYFDERPTPEDINSIGLHIDGLDEGALAVMEGTTFFETIRFADVNMLKHGILEDGAPDFLMEENRERLMVDGVWDGPVALGDSWGQKLDDLEWKVWNYNNAGKTYDDWASGLWHCHFWQYTADLDQW